MVRSPPNGSDSVQVGGVLPSFPSPERSSSHPERDIAAVIFSYEENATPKELPGDAKEVKAELEKKEK
ncbi:UNVERIFIED_CONTAM: hypothetical protein K2H54_074181 [Gekko kuhli]